MVNYWNKLNKKSKPVKETEREGNDF